MEVLRLASECERCLRASEMAQNKARRRARRTYEGGLRLSAASRACARPTQTRDTYQAIYNYAADAGGGSQTFAQGDTWRAALLGTVAA